MQLISGYYAQFTKTGEPNPSLQYLAVRGYTNTTIGVEESGPWEKVDSATGPTKYHNYPSPTEEFPDLAQCTFLNYTISYYLNGGL